MACESVDRTGTLAAVDVFFSCSDASTSTEPPCKQSFEHNNAFILTSWVFTVNQIAWPSFPVCDVPFQATRKAVHPSFSLPLNPSSRLPPHSPRPPLRALRRALQSHQNLIVFSSCTPDWFPPVAKAWLVSVRKFDKVFVSETWLVYVAGYVTCPLNRNCTAEPWLVSVAETHNGLYSGNHIVDSGGNVTRFH